MFIDNTCIRENCPFCFSTDLFCRGKINYTNPILFSNIEIALPYKPELWNCKHCKSSFTQNIIPEHIARKIYAEGDSGARWSQELFHKQKPKEILETLDQLFMPGIRVLDIGCNTGELLNYAKSRGCETAGIEYSAASRTILENNGHTTYPDITSLQGTYDVVTAFDLIEHLYAPRNFFDKCLDILTSNGVCIILTGDINCFSANLTGSSWWYVRYPEHIVFPSIKYLKQFSGMKLHSTVRTFASIGYQFSLYKTVKNVLSHVMRRNYEGLPSIGPDHLLAVLTK